MRQNTASRTSTQRLTRDPLGGARLVGLLLAMCCTGSAMAFQQVSSRLNETPTAVMQRAQALVDKRQYAEAEVLLRRVTAADARATEALYLLAWVEQRQNHPAESLRTYTVAAAQRAPTAEELRRVALDYVLLNSYAEASRWLERAVRMDPRSSEALYDLARVRMHDGKFSDGALLLQASLRLSPGSSKALDNLGVCLEAENDPDGAEKAYRDAVAAGEQPGQANPQALIDLGTLLNTRNGFAEAVPLLQQATLLAPKDAHAHAELGRALQGAGNTTEALKAMQRAVELDPGNSRLHYQLGRIYRAAGQTAQAQAEFAKSAALYGNTSAE